MESITPIDKLYQVRQQISATYSHDPDKYFAAIVAQQQQRAQQGQVYWGYNAVGELVPLTH